MAASGQKRQQAIGKNRLPEPTYAPSKYTMRLCNQALKSAISRFASQMCSLSRHVQAQQERNAGQEYRRARLESEFLLRQLERVAKEFPNLPELLSQREILHRYDLALKSINLEGGRAYANLQALRHSYIDSIRQIQGYIEQLYLSLED